MSPGIAALTIVGVYILVAWGIAFWMGITGDDDEDMVYWCAVLWPMYLVATTICHLGEFFQGVGKKLPSVRKMWNGFILLFLPCRFGSKIREWWNNRRKNETT